MNAEYFQSQKLTGETNNCYELFIPLRLSQKIHVSHILQQQDIVQYRSMSLQVKFYVFRLWKW